MQTIQTPRLQLTRLMRPDRGTETFRELHTLYTDEQASWWNLGGKSKSIEETEAKLQRYLPGVPGTDVGAEESWPYRLSYAVHKVSYESAQGQPEQIETPKEFIGVVNLKAFREGVFPLPDHISLPGAGDPDTLAMEVSYLFLQTAWGKGYATEAVNALLEACKKAKQENKTLWTQYSKIYVRALVSPRNPRSQRVVEKSGLQHISDFDWAGEPVYVAGKWRERDIIQIWGCMLNLV